MDEALGRACRALALKHHVTDERRAFLERESEAEAGFEQGLGLRDVVAPVAVAGLPP